MAALQAAAIPVALFPVNELFVHQTGTGAVQRRQHPRFPISIAHINADSIDRFLHFHGRSFARASYRIAIWTWELPAFREEWRNEIERFDEFWVPSSFCGRAIGALTTKPVIVVPHVVPAPRPTLRHAYRRDLRIEDDEFVFLYIFDTSSAVARKNPHCLIDAFDMAFSSQERVRLVLKASNTHTNPPFAAFLRDLAKRNPRCLVLQQTMSADDLTALLAACDCYVSPHRSEGFGLTVAEAMTHGKPVVATDFGGTADFVTDDVGFLLNYRLIEIEHASGPYGRGAIWSDPSREHLKELLRFVVGNPKLAAEKGRRGRARMRAHYSELAIGQIMRNRLETIHAMPQKSSALT